MGSVKMFLDLAIGETSKIESEDKSKIDNIVGKVRELHGRLTDVRREQVFQRVRPPRRAQIRFRHTDTCRNEKQSSGIRASLQTHE